MRPATPRALAAAALLAALSLAAVSVAAPKEGDKGAAADKGEAKKGEKKPKAKKRGDKADASKDDKSGVAKGISPYDQLLIDANKSFAAGLAGGVIDDAITAYRKAIENDPARPEAHLLLGAALYQKGDFPACAEALSNAASRARADKKFTNVLGKALFLSATVLEAAGKGSDAKAAWQAYEAFAKENPDADIELKDKLPEGAPTPPVLVKVYLASAIEREAKIDAWDKRVAEYAKVKELVLKRQKELGIPVEPAKPAETK